MNVFELFAKLSLDSSEYESGLDDSEKKAGTFGQKLKGGLQTAAKVGVAAVGAVTTAVVATGAAMVKQTGQVAAYGDNIDKMSQKMGLSAQSYQEWDAILQHSGASIETMKTGMKTLATAAETGSDAFAKLGMSQEQIANMSQEELFGATITALQNVEDETQRTYLASQLLGRGGTELGALLNTSAEDTEKMRQRVHELGGVMSDEAVKASAAYQDSLQDMQTSISGIKRGLISDFLPSITTVMDGLTEVFSGNGDTGLGLMKTGISDAIKNLQEAVPRLFEVGKTIVSSLYQAVLENLPQIAEGGTELLISLVTGVTEAIPSLIEAGYTLVSTIVTTIWEHLPELWDAGKSMLENLTGGMDPAELILKGGELLEGFIEKVLEYLPSLIDSGIEFVGKMADGVSQNAPSILSAIGTVISRLITTIIQRAPEFLAKGMELILRMANGLIQALPTIISSMVSLLVRLVATIAQNAPQFLAKGIELIGKLAAGLIQAIPKAVAAIPQIIRGIVSAFKGYDWGSIGRNIIDGVKNGIVNAASRLASAAVEAAKAAFNGVKNFLGIHSPSKKAEQEIGRQWSAGIGIGFEKYMPTDDMVGAVEDAFDALNGTEIRAVQTNYSTYDGNRADGQVVMLLREMVDAIREMTNLGVYMDGKTLVGELVPVLDTAFGREVSYKGRGII